MKRVTIFTDFDTALNPYILLFKQALEGQGLRVRFGRDFNLNWLISKGRSCDFIHLHWIKLSYTPPNMEIRSYFYRRLMENRFVRALLDFLCVVDLALTFLFAKLTGKTIVFTVHDLFQFGKQSLRWKFQTEIAHRIIFLLSDFIHAHNHFACKLIEAKYSRKRRIAVIPHGNYIGYYPNQVSKSEARRHLGLPDDAFVYLFLGLLRPYKGLEDLFDAFKKLKVSEARLLVAGRVFGVDNYETKLKELTRGDSRIKLVSEFIADADIQIYLNACDIFVLPYKDITTSGAAALALSFGRPIVAPNISSFPEILTPESGLLYDISQPDALASALQDTRSQTWSESRILEYAHHFDWTKLGSQLVRLYRTTLFSEKQ